MFKKSLEGLSDKTVKRHVCNAERFLEDASGIKSLMRGLVNFLIIFGKKIFYFLRNNV